VTLLSLVLAGIALAGGSGSLADLFSPAGVVAIVGAFLIGSVEAMRWPIIVVLLVGVLAYLVDWHAAARMRTAYSEFWYVVRSRRGRED
jgi:hypothetical protein